MIFAFDANTISFLLRPSNNPDLKERFKAHIIQEEQPYVFPPLAHYEVLWNLLLKKASKQIQDFNELYQNAFEEPNISKEDITLASQIKANLLKRGVSVGHMDIIIAAYCIGNGYTLVTDNEKDFANIEGLQYVNWKDR